MALKMRWVGDEERERVAETRWMCYGGTAHDLKRYRERLLEDGCVRGGDFLLAEQDGQAVGTVTSMALTMWVRGAPLSCQGVAYVGTIKSARRRGAAQAGVASAIMHETLDMARQRHHILSALMPFRVSFYEHFGYGLVERRSEWTIPLSLMPSGDCNGWRFLQPADHTALANLWQETVKAGQCDVERSAQRWQARRKIEEDGMSFIDRPEGDAAARAAVFVTPETVSARPALRVQEWSADSPAAFAGMLCFLGTLRDQYATATIVLPADWQINRLLREAQVPHRPVPHAAAETRCDARMQLRILDHRRFLEALSVPREISGRLGVAVHESEGNVTRFTAEFADGRVGFSPGGGRIDMECPDRIWSAIATGDLPATAAVAVGLASENSPGASGLLDDCLARGPLPFCREFF